MLAGLYPIAQVREPYSSVGFLGERIPLENVYGLARADDQPWSAWGLCEAYARKRDYTTRHGAWDTYRAGNEMLRYKPQDHLLRVVSCPDGQLVMARRDSLDGRVVLYFYPPKEMPQRPLAFDGTEELLRSAEEEVILQDDQEDEAHSEEEEEDGDEEPSRRNAFSLLSEECP